MQFYFYDDEGLDYQLNPLLSPSLNYYRIEIPSFFENETKYLTMERYSEDDLGDIKLLDRVAVTNPSSAEIFLEESITTAVVSMYLRQQGYIVDPFSERLATPGGFPDLFAAKLPDYQQVLADAGITNGGFYLNELELPEFTGSQTQMPTEEEVALLEIESHSNRNERFYAGKNEARKYLTGRWFDVGFGAKAFAEERIESWREDIEVGFISFNSSGKFTVVDCPRNFGWPERTAEVKERVRTLVKLILLKNLPLKETLDFLDANSFYDTYSSARDTELEAVISRLRGSGVI